MDAAHHDEVFFVMKCIYTALFSYVYVSFIGLVSDMHTQVDAACHGVVALI